MPKSGVSGHGKIADIAFLRKELPSADFLRGENMDRNQIKEFREVLGTIMGRSTREWVYLPSDRNWSLQSMSATLVSEEVPPDNEDAPDAGVPQLAKANGLIQTIDVATLQDIVSNARMQSSSVTPDDLFRAFKFYYDHDAFIEF